VQFHATIRKEAREILRSDKGGYHLVPDGSIADQEQRDQDLIDRAKVLLEDLSFTDTVDNEVCLRGSVFR
jgi:hypothetical protein